MSLIKLTPSLMSLMLMGALLMPSAALADGADSHERGMKESARESVEKARERSNAQWTEGAERGRDRAESVKSEGKRKAYGHGKDKEKKWKDKAKREREELEGEGREMKERSKKMGDDAADKAEDAKRKVSESAKETQETASEVREEAEVAADSISAEAAKANASPKGEARGFWARFFGRGGAAE